MEEHFRKDDEDKRELAYELDDWERYSWRQFLRLIGRSHDASELKQWKDRRPEWALLGREIFGRLLTKDDLVEADEPEDWAVKVHGEADDLPEWRTLMELCAGYRYDAGVAALAIANHLHDEFEGELPDGDGEGEGDQDGEGEGQGQGGGGQGDGDGDGDQDADGDGQRSSGEKIRDALRKAAAQAQEDTTERRDAMRALGVGWGSETAQHVRDNGQRRQAIEVAKKLHRDAAFKSLANLAGRMRSSIRAKRAARLKGKPAELSDVILGNDLARMLPTEMAKLRRRPLRLDLLRRLTERQVAQYEVTGREVAERGPMVVAIDFSGSMDGENLKWAKGIALALASVARDQRRPFLSMAFDTRVLGTYEDTQGVKELMDFINRDSAGGTSWTEPLEAAKARIEDPKVRRFEQGDIILITDGECGTDDTWNTKWKAWRMSSGVHCYGIHIDDSNSCRGTSTLARITDEVFQIAIQRSGKVTKLDQRTDEILQRFAEVL